MELEETVGTVILKPGRAKPVIQRHPWIFSGAIQRIDGKPPAGSLVEVRSAKHEWLGTGYYNHASQIRVRTISFDKQQTIDDKFWRTKLEQAINGRKHLYHSDENNAYRLINAESDQLPGLIVDRYEDYLVMQCLTAGMDLRKSGLAENLMDLLPVKGVYERSDVAIRKKEGMPQTSGVLAGVEPPDRQRIKLAGIQLNVDLRKGHKTGLYLDQCTNYRILREDGHLSDKDVLNLFSYTGGFGLHAVRAGARSVIHVDSSIPALEEAERNVLLNGWKNRDNDEYLAGDVFEVLRHYDQTGQTFDTIILDPPKFAHNKGDVNRASRGYKDLNRLAFRLIRPGGILATFSCSGLISDDLFQKIVFGALLDSGREAQILRRLHQGEDHPVALTFPEGAYLKGLLCRVH